MTVHTITLPNPSERMNFDGERFVTGVPGEIAHEHYLRYLFAQQFCAGKDVLDVASGEGYGSSMLGTVARTVHGTDLLEEAVAYATRQYGSERIRFSQGDVRKLPLPDASFDVIVSFETLEHITEHERFLAEIKRVLRPGGLLVMSSPNRDVYLAGEAPNPFHRREPDRAEFTAMLAGQFRHCRIAQQRPLTGALLCADTLAVDDRIETFAMRDGVVERHDGLGDSTYLIGLASEAELPAVAWGVLVDVGYLNKLHAAHQADIRSLQESLSYLQDENTKLKALNGDLGEQLTHLQTAHANAEASLVSADERCREEMVKQRTRLLTDVLEIFS